MTTRNRDEVREFLTTRRARVRPDQVHLAPGPNRRVPGLRRTEVALLAGVSVEYYSRLERGDIAGTSEDVLHAIASAPQSDEAERDHLYDLARAAGPSPKRRARSAHQSSVRPSLQHALDAVTGGPVLVRNGWISWAATQLHRQIAIGDRRIQTPTTPGIVKSQFPAPARRFDDARTTAHPVGRSVGPGRRMHVWKPLPGLRSCAAAPY